MADRVGQRFGDYTLLCFLGSGTFGDVYLGEHLYEKKQVAVKIFKAQLTPEKMKDFINEVRIIRLKHPNIVELLDFGIGEHDIPYLVMVLAPNGTVLRRHPRGTRLPLATVVTYTKQIAAALQYAHDQRLIHRDVKPENMLFGTRNELLLTDFGIAVVAHSTHSQRTEEAIGTALYMAPEQWQGKPLPATDQYALGIIVYEWLCGGPPFQGGMQQLMYLHIYTSPPPLHDKAPTISPEVERVVLTALAKDPKDRFTTVKAFAMALEQAAQPAQRLQPQSAADSNPQSQPLVWLAPKPPPSQVLPSFFTPPSHPLPVTKPVTLPNTLLPRQVNTGLPKTVPGRTNLPSPALQPVPVRRTPQLSKRGISRRTIIVGLAGLAIVGAAGGAWWIFAAHPLYTYRGHFDGVFAVAWSPDGKRIASGGGDSTVQVWDATDGGNVYTYRGHSNGGVFAVAWSPDGKRIASFGGRDGTVQVWDATDGGNVYTYRGHVKDAYSGTGAVAWSPNGKRIASGGNDNTAQVWDAADGGNVYTYKEHAYSVDTVAWSPDGKRIASGSGDGTAQVWDAADGGNVYTYTRHVGFVSGVSWSRDGKRIASGGRDGTVQVWDAADGGNVYTYTGHSDIVNAVAWSTDGKRIASGSRDGTVQVWDAADGGNVYTYTGHSGWVFTVAWSRDGKRIASGGRDSTVQVWQAE